MRNRKKKNAARANGSSSKKAQFANRPFEGLKAKTESSGAKEPHQEEKSDKQPQNDLDELGDTALYDREMADVAPIKNPGKLAMKEPLPKPFLKCADEDILVMRELDELVHGDTPFDFADTDEYIEASVAGLDKRLLRKLKRGEFSIEAHLDLHGLNREQARVKVAKFIRDRHNEGRRCVLIVHGRGIGSRDNIPVLKTKLASWLTRGAIGRKVMAFTSARPYDGGTGAVYVLLRGSKR